MKTYREPGVTIAEKRCPLDGCGKLVCMHCAGRRTIEARAGKVLAVSAGDVREMGRALTMVPNAWSYDYGILSLRVGFLAMLEPYR